MYKTVRQLNKPPRLSRSDAGSGQFHKHSSLATSWLSILSQETYLLFLCAERDGRLVDSCRSKNEVTLHVLGRVSTLGEVSHRNTRRRPDWLVSGGAHSTNFPCALFAVTP